MSRQIESGQFRGRVLIRSNARLIAHRKKWPKGFDILRGNRLHQFLSRNNRLRESSSEANAVPSESRLLDRHN